MVKRLIFCTGDLSCHEGFVLLHKENIPVLSIKAYFRGIGRENYHNYTETADVLLFPVEIWPYEIKNYEKENGWIG